MDRDVKSNHAIGNPTTIATLTTFGVIFLGAGLLATLGSDRTVPVSMLCLGAVTLLYPSYCLLRFLTRRIGGLNRKQEWVIGIAAIISSFLVLVWVVGEAAKFAVSFLILTWIAALIVCWLLRD
jgi:hypothetical protein